MLKILVASNAFKGSLTPTEACNAIAAGIARAAAEGVTIDTAIVPLADGGDGTLEAIHAACGGIYHSANVQDAVGHYHEACWLEVDNQAFVELASVCGIADLKGKLQPTESHTFGLGEMIRACVGAGTKVINITLGGSASTDGGMGVLAALGARFFDKHGATLASHGGSSLASIHDIDISPVYRLLDGIELNTLTDVRNPLLGPTGAAQIFGAQKGASSEQINQLDAGLKNFADVLEAAVGRTCRNKPGAGAAGGTAFALACALNANVQSGFDWLLENARLTKKIQWCDLVITGEGRFDEQSLHGKTIGELLKLCTQHHKRLWVVAGSIQIDNNRGIERTIQPDASVSGGCSASEIADAVAKNLLP